jgi:hypothetical protein
VGIGKELTVSECGHKIYAAIEALKMANLQNPRLLPAQVKHVYKEGKDVESSFFTHLSILIP